MRKLEPAQLSTKPDSTAMVFVAILLVKSLSVESVDGVHSAVNSAVCEPAAVFNSAVQ